MSSEAKREGGALAVARLRAGSLKEPREEVRAWGVKGRGRRADRLRRAAMGGERARCARGRDGGAVVCGEEGWGRTGGGGGHFLVAVFTEPFTE